MLAKASGAVATLRVQMKTDKQNAAHFSIDPGFFDDEFALEIDQLASRLMQDVQCHGAFVNVLIEGKRLFSLGVGNAADVEPVRIHPSEGSMCTYAAQHADPLILPDARQHDVFKSSPQVEAGLVASYLGQPITDSLNRAFGTVSAIHAEPRIWSKSDIALVRAYAAQASSLFLIRQLRFEAQGLHTYINEADRALMSLSNSLTGLISVHDANGQEIFATAELRSSVGPSAIEDTVRTAIAAGLASIPATSAKFNNGPIHLGAFSNVLKASDGRPGTGFSLQLWRSTQDTFYAFWNHETAARRH